DEAVLAPGRGGVLALVFGRDDGKQRHRRNAGRQAALGQLEQAIAAAALDARHRIDRLAAVGVFQHESRLNQVGRRKPGLAREFTGKAAVTRAAHAGCWENHVPSRWFWGVSIIGLTGLFWWLGGVARWFRDGASRGGAW